MKMGGIQGIAERIVPLEHLLYALEGIDTGERDPMLRPGKLGHASKTALFEQGRRASAAAAMSLLMGSGHSKSEASAIVARRLSTASGPAVRASAVADWREKVTGEDKRENFGALWFHRLVRRLPALFADDKKKAAEFLLDHPLEHFSVVLRLAEQRTKSAYRST
jgi:hypothetical protein